MSQNKAETVRTELKDGFAILYLQKEPVNSMNLPFFQELESKLDQCEKDPKIRGVIFASGLSKNIFTAGNDINELWAKKTNEKRYREFWETSNRFFGRLLNSPLLTVAAVKGACPAAGCCLSMCCDFRIITKDGSMALNEVALGIPVPEIWVKLMSSIIGQGKADKLTQFAKFVKADEAEKIGLVDLLVEDSTKLIPTAESVITKLLMLPDLGRQATKDHLRKTLSAEWCDPQRLSKESQIGWERLSSEATVNALSLVMERLSGGKAKL